MASLRIDLFGTECNTGALDADGCAWNAVFDSGWDSPDLRLATLDPSGHHGVISALRLAGGRVLTIRGKIHAPNESAAWVKFAQVTGQMPGLSESGDVVVHEPDVKTLTVVRGGEPRVSTPLNNVISYQLTLLAEYPWKIGSTATTTPLAASGSATISNAGTAPAELEVTVTSAGTLALTVGALTLTSGPTVVPSGTVIKTADRSVVDSLGVAFYPLAHESLWPALAPGSNSASNSGTAGLSIVSRNTYA